ncbi:Hypothetical protein I596_1187 [Dokdonella koreensis DS-123]|uniref:Uncharacterized protein n=1 Tax=Dokdonella koreensis DS-123 TaxID=1300342 RepID=A0A160DSF7_9GAMM|nr:Hypothetical protein I596_1187 [Dokdonella koreensis DS-123]
MDHSRKLARRDRIHFRGMASNSGVLSGAGIALARLSRDDVPAELTG